MTHGLLPQQVSEYTCSLIMVSFFPIYLPFLNTFISIPINNDADTVHLIHLLFDFFFLFSLLGKV